MTRRTPPTQLSLCFDDPRGRPPSAPPTPAVMETLADLLLAAVEGLRSGEAGDEPQDRH